MTEDSKPIACPCCGADARIRFAPGYGADSGPDRSMALIACKECGLSSGHYKPTSRAIADWNRRAAPVIASRSEEEPVAVSETTLLDRVAEAINDARYDTDMWRDRPRPVFADEDKGSREYAYRLARSALLATTPRPSELVAARAVTDAMVDVAVAEMNKPAANERREVSMRRVLEAALATPGLAASRPTVDGWQDISTAPKDGQTVLVASFGKSGELRWAKQSRWMTEEDAAEFEGGMPGDYEAGWTDGDDEGDYCFPTHWSRLPALTPIEGI